VDRNNKHSDVVVFAPNEIKSLLKHKEVSDTWAKMKEGERIFFVTWLTNGYNATRAYMAMSVKAKYTTAKVEGFKYLARPSFFLIRKYLQLNLKTVLQRITDVEIELLDSHDEDVRLKAAKQLRDHAQKFLIAVAVPDSEDDKKGQTNIQNNYFIGSEQFDAIKGVLNG